MPERFTSQFLSQIEMLQIRSRRAFLGSRQGGHLSPKRGHGIEFSDYRKYELGDNPRHIDWGVYGRTDKLYIKRFQEEQDLSVLVILDTSASMGVPADEGKWEMARDLTLALAYIALMEHDSVIVSALGSFHSPSLYGGRAIHALSDMFSKVKLGDLENLDLEIGRASSRIRFPGVAIFISDFLMPFSSVELAFNTLRAKNLDLTAIQVLSPSDLNPLSGVESAMAEDSETGEILDLALDPGQRQSYSAMLDEHNEKLKEYLARSRIPYALALSSSPLADFVQGDLSKTGLLG